MTTQTNLDLVWASTGTATDPGDSKYAQGWLVEIPTYQHFNFVLQNNSKNMLTLAEQGSHEWQTEIPYQPGARVRRVNKFYTCKTASQGTTLSGEDPNLDTNNTYWMSGLLLGNDNMSNALAVRGMHVKDVNPRFNATTWDGNDITLESKCPIIAMNVEGAAKNWGVANVTGELCAVDLDLATLPDNGSIALAAARTYRLYHEGHKPTQTEIAGTIPEAPSDSKYYTRLNASWVERPVATSASINLGLDNVSIVTCVAIKGATLWQVGVSVTASAAELNKMDGCTSTTAELNILDGVTANAGELNKMDGCLATTAELNVIDGNVSPASSTLHWSNGLVMNISGIIKQIQMSSLTSYLASLAQTLTNKILTSPVINSSISGTAIDTTVTSSTTKIPRSAAVLALVNDRAPDIQTVTVGDIGTYALLHHWWTGAVLPGETKTGFELRYADVDGANNGTNLNFGTWMLMGYKGGGATAPDRTSLWLRVA